MIFIPVPSPNSLSFWDRWFLTVANFYFLVFFFTEELNCGGGNLLDVGVGGFPLWVGDLVVLFFLMRS